MHNKSGKFMLACCLVLGAVAVAGLLYGGVPSFHAGKNTQGQYQDISVAQFDAALKERDPFLVDVHIPREDPLPGTDAFIPYNEVGERLGEFPQDRSAEILVYCRSGSMSTQASQVLAAAGYTNVKNLIGGVQAWRESHQGIELTPETVDLGTVVYGEVARTQFILTNTTPNPLTITRVSTSCTCTKAQVQKTLLKPYETTVVDVSFDPAVHKDDTDLGDITRTIYIETDNINAKKIDSSITAHVIKDNS